MKRYLLILLLLLPACSESEAWMSPVIIGGGVVSAGLDAGCQSGATFTWNASHTSGTNYACDSAGNGLEGTVTGDASITGGYLLIPGQDDYLIWTTDSSEIVSSLGTIYADVYIDDNLSNTDDDPDNTQFWEWQYDADNRLMAIISGANDGLYCYYRTGGVSVTAIAKSGAVTVDAWYRMGYAWDVTNGDHSASLVVCSGSNCSGVTHSWEDDDDELTGALASEPTNFKVGELDGALGMTDAARVKNVMVFSTYKADDPL